MKNTIQILLSIFFVTCCLVGCAGVPSETPGAPTPTLSTLIPYRTPTATRMLPTPTPVINPPVTPAPSLTPFTHLVVRGETMLGIAIRYGVTLEVLQAANPGVDPQFLSVGAQLVIPLGDEVQVAAATPTPVMVTWSDPACYPTGDGGVWCFLLVENNLSAVLENLSAWIGLFTREGEIITSQVAVGPVNILRPGQAMPLIAFFPSPLPVDFNARGELLTAVEVPGEDSRYLDWPISDLSIVIGGEENKEARVTGQIDQPDGSTSPGQVWIAAVAYDHDGTVVGVRKYETVEDMFDLTVFSLGGAIEWVEVLTEIRP